MTRLLWAIREWAETGNNPGWLLFAGFLASLIALLILLFS